MPETVLFTTVPASPDAPDHRQFSAPSETTAAVTVASLYAIFAGGRPLITLLWRLSRPSFARQERKTFGRPTRNQSPQPQETP